MEQDRRANVDAFSILLVEDNLADSELIALELAEVEEFSFVVTQASRLSEACTLLVDGNFNLVLLDLGLPDSQGMDTFETARAASPHMPFIVLTGLDDAEIGLRAVQAGAQDYMVKGQVTGQLLVRAIRYAVQREDARRKIELLNTELEERVAERTRELEESNLALQHANDELKALDRMKTSFIRVATHELSTPVQVMGGMLGILGMLPPGDDERRGEALDIAHKGAERLQRMVTRVLEVAQAGAYRQPVQRDLVQPELLVRQVRDQVAPFAAVRNLKLRLDLPHSLPQLSVNAAQVRDVLLNLVMNAIKFTPDGGEVTVAIQRGPGEPVRFSVRDTGAGIAEADRPHIFEQFFSSFDTLHHSSGEFEYGRRGIGLGLAIAKEFVELHGGGIWLAESSPDGSTFCFTLPLGT